MNTPDPELYKLYRERERLSRDLYLLDEKLNKHLFNKYSLKKVRAVYQGQPTIPGISPNTIDDREIDFP